ncbi:diguanylate cyclase [Salimicrobium sp. PL1-032A]|uniref:GGDEF domain-containing protein n=1 Tax=Salimicrobium sp. PL1-032A TaxID=3095364 RepID=UPI00325FF05B
MIIKELLSNLAILITSLFLYTQITGRSSSLRITSSYKTKVAAGILAGVLSNVLMQYSMVFNETIIDLRHVPLIVVAYYGGTLPAVTATVLIVLGRLMIGVNMSSFLGAILVVFIAMTTLLTRRLNVKRGWKIFLSLTASNLVFTIIIAYLLQDLAILMVLVPAFWIVSYLSGYTAFYLIEYVRGMQRVLERYKAQASTDALTGLNNVRKFDELFNEISVQAEQKEEKLTLLYIDIDHFKHVNDTYGHKEGDQVLIELGELLKQNVRSFDIVSRNGGEEFTVLLLDCKTDRGEEISERIRKAVQAHSFMLTTGEVIHVTVSIGLACYNETTKTPEMLLEEADEALYKAKKTGRNKVCISSGVAYSTIQ